MKLFLWMSVFCLNLSAFAQLKPVYFVGNTVVKDSTKATSYGVYGKLSGEDLYVLKVFDLNDNLKVTGSYKDEKLEIAHGTFVYYEDVDVFNRLNNTSFVLHGKRRFVSGRGSYANGFEQGRWITFYPNGKIMGVTTFVNGVKHGFYGTYNRKGKIIVSGTYRLDEKDGEWIYDHGKVKENYIHGVRQLPAEKKSNKSKSN